MIEYQVLETTPKQIYKQKTGDIRK